jgi:probable F420-dependent oxidoreductase
MKLTKFGVWIGRALTEPDYGEAARVAEELGYGAIWLGGSPRLPTLRPMLAATEKIVVATGIVNIWQYEPVTLTEEFAALDEEFPGRLLLGVGIGHPEATSEYQKPLTKTREFLDAIASAPVPVPRERMVAAALGPKMLDLSFERTLGAHPYFVPVEHTSFARDRLGPQALLAPELAVVLDEDPERARATARKYAHGYLGLTNYTGNLRRLGWSDEDLANGGSEKLIDAVVPQGSVAKLARDVQAHLDAGADHVCVQPLGVDGVPRVEWAALATALGL